MGSEGWVRAREEKENGDHPRTKFDSKVALESLVSHGIHHKSDSAQHATVQYFVATRARVNFAPVFNPIWRNRGLGQTAKFPQSSWLYPPFLTF